MTVQLIASAKVDTEYWMTGGTAGPYVERQLTTTVAIDAPHAVDVEEAAEEYARRNYHEISGLDWRRASQETQDGWLRVARERVQEMLDIIEFLSTTAKEDA